MKLLTEPRSHQTHGRNQQQLFGCRNAQHAKADRRERAKYHAAGIDHIICSNGAGGLADIDGRGQKRI